MTANSSLKRSPSPAARAGGKGRVLLIAASCDPAKSMESRVGWHRALQSARWHETWVLHGGPTSARELAKHAAAAQTNYPIHFLYVPNSPLGALLGDPLGCFWASYRMWHQEVYRMARRLHAEVGFDLIHQANYCGYREPGFAWKLGVPMVWGPVGGTQNFPLRFLGECDLGGGTREVLRSFANSLQLRWSSRVRMAGKKAVEVLAATTTAQRDLARCQGIDSICMLETGIEHVGLPREPLDRSRPFRLLWAGRLRTWKGMGLMLKGLAQLPRDFQYEVRVLGVGSSQRAWQRMATRLGVADRITWLGWPDYADTLPHYRWADATIFTSLRDTSGTGLLESLAAGTPIVGLNHQGAADILTPECAMPIGVSHPRQVARDMASAIVQLGNDPDMWLTKSLASQRRSEAYLWDRLGEGMEACYQRVLRYANVECCSKPIAPSPSSIDSMEELSEADAILNSAAY